MITVRSKSKLRDILRQFRWNNPGQRVGFVPTMGYLHQGHGSLIQAACSENDLSVVSIYVNPMQFGPNEDLSRYPRDEKGDARYCTELGVDILFIPDAEEVYHPEHSTIVSLPDLSGIMCGEFRPSHFDGVATVVTKLFNLVDPDTAYFGRKDFQQAAILDKMVQDLDFNIEMKILDTFREPDGLAMSSRNAYLSETGRAAAPVLFRGLNHAARSVSEGETDVARILSSCRDIIEANSDIQIQYLECRSLQSLSQLDRLDQPAVIALAAFLEKVRLIDNVIVAPPERSGLK